MAEDDLDFDDEDDFLKEYKAKRMAQMKESAARPKFGDVIEITKQDWEYHVTRAPTDVWVIVVLYQNQ